MPLTAPLIEKRSAGPSRTRRQGEVVARENLLREVWAGTYTYESGVFRVVSELRRALGDQARTPRYIETIPKRGYRLIAPVEVGAPAMPSNDRPLLPARGPLGTFRVGASLLAAVTAALLGHVATLERADSSSTAPPEPLAFTVGQVWEDRVDCAAYARARAAYEEAIRNRALRGPTPTLSTVTSRRP